MNTLQALLISFGAAYVVLVGIHWIISVGTYGTPKSDKLICEAILKNYTEYGYSVNSLDQNIITIGKMPYISTAGWKINGFVYHVSDVGLIPIWYKSHKMIDTIFKHSKMSENSENSLRNKLNLD